MRGKVAKRLRRMAEILYKPYAVTRMDEAPVQYTRHPDTGVIRCVGVRALYLQYKAEHKGARS